jgi:hypothetical protein
MKVIIDRFEGDDAILEMPDLRFVSAPRILFDQAKEGDVVSICVDLHDTEKRKKNIKKLMDQLFDT